MQQLSNQFGRGHGETGVLIGFSGAPGVMAGHPPVDNYERVTALCGLGKAEVVVVAQGMFRQNHRSELDEPRLRPFIKGGELFIRGVEQL